MNATCRVKFAEGLTNLIPPPTYEETNTVLPPSYEQSIMPSTLCRKVDMNFSKQPTKPHLFLGTTKRSPVQVQDSTPPPDSATSTVGITSPTMEEFEQPRDDGRSLVPGTESIQSQCDIPVVQQQTCMGNTNPKDDQ